jgi:hypothetical protein
MGWDKGKSYTRSKKVNGRVVREYVGCGRVGELVAQLDALERLQRAEEREAKREEKARQEEFDALLDDLNDVADLMAYAAMAAAGYRRHNRGEWRKRRG